MSPLRPWSCQTERETFFLFPGKQHLGIGDTAAKHSGGPIESDGSGNSTMLSQNEPQLCKDFPLWRRKFFYIRVSPLVISAFSFLTRFIISLSPSPLPPFSTTDICRRSLSLPSTCQKGEAWFTFPCYTKYNKGNFFPLFLRSFMKLVVEALNFARN